MIHTIMEAVCMALRTEFGEGYGICMEKAGQDVKAPYFSIQCLDSSRELFRGKRYHSHNQFGIRYVPLSQEDRNGECYSVLDRLYPCLEYIQAGRLVRGTQMRGKVADGILEFFVQYDCFVYEAEEEEPGICDMTIHTDVKEGD